MKYKLIACDIDGTLVNSKSQVTAETCNAVKNALDKGVKFVLATGRPYQGVKNIIETLGLYNCAYILYNGATVMVGDKIEKSFYMPVNLAFDIIKEGHKRGSTIICWADNKMYTEETSPKIQYYKALAGTEPLVVDDLLKINLENVAKIVWYDSPCLTARYYKEMFELFGDKANVFPSRCDFLEFVSLDCNKGTALKAVAKYYNIDLSQTVAVGDSYNDLSMLRVAGLPCAMANGEDDVKNFCKYVTDSCDNSGVAKLINKLLDENFNC